LPALLHPTTPEWKTGTTICPQFSRFPGEKVSDTIRFTCR
jgi:hypothetical protein